MSGRYPDDAEYRRRREPAREQRDPRERIDPRDRDRDRETRDRNRPTEDYRRGDTQMTDVLDPRIDRTDISRSIDPRIDPRTMDIRHDPRIPSSTTRRDHGPDRILDSRNPDPPEREVVFQDPATGQIYRQVAPSRQYPPRDERDYIDPPTTRRTPVDGPGSQLNEYFCPGEGIEREVIQHEICKYLGQDALCWPGKDPKTGRSGFIVKAYRPFTSAMEQSLRDETVKWQRERQRRRKYGESQGSYADMVDQQETGRRYPGPPDSMDLDDDHYQRPPQRRRDERDYEPRPVNTGRVSIPVTSGYPPEAGYPAQYAISSPQPGYIPGQPPYYPPERDPRATEPRSFATGNTPPPPTSRGAPVGGYAPSGYSSRTASSVAQSIPSTYAESRPEVISRGAYPSNYPGDRRR